MQLTRKLVLPRTPGVDEVADRGDHRDRGSSPGS